MKKILIQDNKLGPKTVVAATICFIATFVAGCSTSENPFDQDRSADDELPATAETFAANPETTRNLSTYDNFEFFIAQPSSSADSQGDLCLLIVEDDITATESCGEGPIIDIGVQGVRAQYYFEGEAEETDAWEKLAPNLRVKTY
ncbi:MAG: hypothetical protein HLX51_01460 [Micrococcaceae bacterium]|nr:hypothetical protein [Micrococcaceae bacterium]